MARKIISTLSLCLFFTITLSNVQAQTNTPSDTVMLGKLVNYMSELEFELALQTYVKSLFLKHGEDNLPNEKFLVSVMRLTNHEMRRRIDNPKAASDKYFEALYHQLDEIQALKERLKSSQISELDSFIRELERRMKLTIEEGEVNYKKKRVFEDALQLLYVAEEMIQLDQLRDPENLGNKISGSKDKLLNAFGEVGDVSAVELDVKPTIFNLFAEWKNNKTYKYTARLLDVKLARLKLMQSGGMQDVLRMFNDQLQTAYMQFNYGDYMLADKLLEDIAETYSKAGIKEFEDVLFYRGESNFALLQLNKASEIYRQLIDLYPNTSFLTRSLSRLIQISYKLNMDNDVALYFDRYQNFASPADPDWGEIQFISALSMYRQADFNKAIEVFMSFPKTSRFYYLSQYMVGAIYASGQNRENAIQVLETIIADRATPAMVRERAAHKLALIYYENGSYISAIENLNLIPESYDAYDRVLNAFAWSFFALEQAKDREVDYPDYTQTKYFAQRLLDEYYASDYRMECESLLAYISQLEGNPGEALTLYNKVYQAKTKKKQIDDFIDEKERIKNLYAQAKDMEEKALRENNQKAYIQSTDLAASLEEQLYELELAESSPFGSSVGNEIRALLSSLDQLLLMKEQAKAKNNIPAVMKADSMIIRLSAVLETFPEEVIIDGGGYSWFDAYPVSQNLAETEHRNKKNHQFKNDLQREMTRIDAKIDSLSRLAEREKMAGNYKRVIVLEKNVQQLKTLRDKNDRLYAYAASLNDENVYEEFNQWGDFGAFGVIDVQFGQRERISTKMAEVSRLYNSVNDVAGERRSVLEDRFKKIEAEIRFMTMKARLAERVRQRAERERSFRETYFDKRTSEFEDR